MIRTHRRYVAEINGTEKEYVELSCDSMDTKPSVTGLINGSMLTETDTGKVYMVDEDAGDWVEQFSLQDMGGGGGSGLPPVTSEDNGKVLGVEDGEWGPVEAPSGLPDVSASDNGKVLTVENGAWAAAAQSGYPSKIMQVNKSGTQLVGYSYGIKVADLATYPGVARLMSRYVDFGTLTTTYTYYDLISVENKGDDYLIRVKDYASGEEYATGTANTPGAVPGTNYLTLYLVS